MSNSVTGICYLHLGRQKNSGGPNNDFGYNDRMVFTHLLAMAVTSLTVAVFECNLHIIFH